MHFGNFSRIVRNKTIDSKSIIILNDDKQNYTSVDLNYCLDTSCLELTNQNSLRVSKVLSQLLRYSSYHIFSECLSV